MKIFISWSGVRSCYLAEKLRDWLKSLNHKIEPWMSKRDIDAGTRWPLEIANKLESISFGISILTPENATSPWLNFEAGALSKEASKSHVCTYLYAMEPGEIPRGPLTQFQAKRADEQGTRELVETLNASMGDDALSPDLLLRQFERIWRELELEFRNVPSPESAIPTPPPADKMLAEILELVRRTQIMSVDARRLRDLERMVIEQYKTLEKLGVQPSYAQYLVVGDAMAHERMDSPKPGLVHSSLREE